MGFAVLLGHPDAPRDLELESLYVLASRHGSGAGQSLLDAVISDRPAYLWVADNNPRARAFYTRNGSSRTVHPNTPRPERRCARSGWCARRWIDGRLDQTGRTQQVTDQVRRSEGDRSANEDADVPEPGRLRCAHRPPR